MIKQNIFGITFGLKRFVLLDFYSNFLFKFLFMFANPTIVIYMISNVDPFWYKSTLVINTGGVLLGGIFLNKSRLIWLRNHFTYLCLFDALFMIIINLFFGHMPNVRFVSIALSEAFITYYIMQIIGDMYNNAFRKSTITLLDTKLNAYNSAGTLLGVSVSMLFTISIDTALIISTISIIIDSLISIFLRQKMGNMIKGYNK